MGSSLLIWTMADLTRSQQPIRGKLGVMGNGGLRGGGYIRFILLSYSLTQKTTLEEDNL